MSILPPQNIGMMKPYPIVSLVAALLLCLICTSNNSFAQKPAAKTSKEKTATPPKSKTPAAAKQKAAPKSKKATKAASTARTPAPKPVESVKTTVATDKTAPTTTAASPVAKPDQKGAAAVAVTSASTAAATAKGLATDTTVQAKAISTDSSTALPAATILADTNKAAAITLFEPAKNSPAMPPYQPAQGFWAIVPLLLALLLSVWWREGVLSLFLGILMGAWALNGFQLDRLLLSSIQVFDTHLIQTLSDPQNVRLAVFVLLMGGIASLSWHNGGAAGWVAGLSSTVRSPRGAQMAAWLSALVGFFDPLVSATLSGNLARPLTDKYRGSREKLAYIINTTGSSVSVIAVLSTFAVVMTSSAGQYIAAWGSHVQPLSIWLYALQYAFYPIFALLWAVATVLWQRDFGAMHRAERRSLRQGKLYDSDIDPSAEASVMQQLPTALNAQEPPRGFYLVLPLLVFLLTTYYGLFGGAKAMILGDPSTLLPAMLQSLQQADIGHSLLYGAAAALLTSVLLTLLGGKLDMRNTVDSILAGMKTAFPTLITLFLALVLVGITAQLGAANWLAQWVGTYLSAPLMPLLAFVVAAIVAAATGSFVAATLLVAPILLPAAMAQSYGAALLPQAAATVFYGTLASIASGALFGTHCAITAQNSLVTALSAQCPPADHIRTQLPYALLMAALSMVAMALCLFFNLPPWIPLLGGIALIPLLVRLLGKSPYYADDLDDEIAHVQATQISAVTPLESTNDANFKTDEIVSSQSSLTNNNTSADLSGDTHILPKHGEPALLSLADDTDSIDVRLPETSALEAWQYTAEADDSKLDTIKIDTHNEQDSSPTNTPQLPAELQDDRPKIEATLTQSDDDLDTVNLHTPAADEHQSLMAALDTAELPDNFEPTHEAETNPDYVTEAVSKTKDMFQSMKDIIAAVSQDEAHNNESELTHTDQATEQPEPPTAATEQKKIRYIADDDDDDKDPIIRV